VRQVFGDIAAALGPVMADLKGNDLGTVERFLNECRAAILRHRAAKERSGPVRATLTIAANSKRVGEILGRSLMAVKVRVPGPLRRLTAGESVVEVDGGTVAEALDALEKRYPGFRERLYDQEGQLRQFVNVYKNDEDVRFGSGLATPLQEGDDLSIVPAVAGGRMPFLAAAYA